MFSDSIYSMPDSNLRPRMGFSEGEDAIISLSYVITIGGFTGYENGIDHHQRTIIAMAIANYIQIIKQELRRDIDISINGQSIIRFPDAVTLLNEGFKKSDEIKITISSKPAIPRNFLKYIMDNIKRALEDEDYVKNGKNISSSISIFCELVQARRGILEAVEQGRSNGVGI